MDAAPHVVDPISQIITYLLSFGLPGVCLIVLGWAYRNKDRRVDDLQDTIIKMATEQSKAIAESTGAINSLRDLLTMRNKAE